LVEYVRKILRRLTALQSFSIIPTLGKQSLGTIEKMF
jgi:hypothetical protein